MGTKVRVSRGEFRRVGEGALASADGFGLHFKGGTSFEEAQTIDAYLKGELSRKRVCTFVYCTAAVLCQ